MKSVKIEGNIRSEKGKTAARQLRAEGSVPCVIYGGKENIHFSASQFALRSLVYTPDFQLAEVSIGGSTRKCILKDLQFNVVTDELSHVDFLELTDDRKVIANLPIKFTGQAKGVKDGGRLVTKLKTLKVRTYPKYLTENIEVKLDELELHGNIRVEDVQLANVEVLNSPRIPIASVTTTRELRKEDEVAAKPAEGAAAPAAGAAPAPAAEAKKK
jgi:large subunit ribosomal protein L25